MTFEKIKQSWLKDKIVVRRRDEPNLTIGSMIIPNIGGLEAIVEPEVMEEPWVKSFGVWRNGEYMGIPHGIPQCLTPNHHAVLFNPFGDGTPVARANEGMSFELLIKAVGFGVVSIEFAFAAILKNGAYFSVANRPQSLSMPTLLVTEHKPKLGKPVMWSELYAAIDCLRAWKDVDDGY